MALALILLLSLTAACGDVAPETARVAADSAVVATDDVGRRVELERPARRVVSLLPAATETLFDLGAGERVVGRTRYDTDPRLAALPSVGGGLDPSLEELVALRPDLVVAWESPTGSRVRERLESLGIPVFAASTRDTAAIYHGIAALGRLTGRDAAADSLARRLRARLDGVRATVAPGPRPGVLYVVSLDPVIVSGLDNFIAEMISVAGGEPMAVSAEQRGGSPQVSLEEVVRRDPDMIVLPVGADPGLTLERLRREPGWRELSAVREERVATIPAEMVRPSAAIGELAEWLAAAIRGRGTPP